MSKSMVERPPAYRGPSKIPRFGQAHNPLPDIGMDPSNDTGKRPSKLMQLKSDYHNKILREKEEKMIKMYEDNQKKALDRVNSKGMVRDFFRERREIESSNGISTNIPTINQHFQRRRNEEKMGEPDLFEKRKVPNEVKRGGYVSRYATGRDKSRPLAPIDRDNESPPFARKPQIHGRPWTKEDKKPKNKTGAFAPRSAPAPNGFHPNNDYYGGAASLSSNDDTPPPNLSQLKMLQKQKIKTNRSNISPSSQRSKMSDFQKWQAEQDEARNERLKKLNRAKSESDEENIDEGDDDEIMSRQKILMEQIQRQKEELERMRIDRQREEEEERREMEKRRKREEDRRRRVKEETERRRQLEEDQPRQEEKEMMERERRRREEEVQRRLEEDSRMMTNRTNRTNRSEFSHTNRNKMEDDFVKAEDSYRSAPSPPKNPKPARVKRPAGNPKHTQKQFQEEEETPSRVFTSDVNMYADAANIDGAYEKIKTVPCRKCGRKFAADRVERHMNSCDNLTKKRKILDPTKLRTAGTEMEQYNRNPQLRAKTPPKKHSNWRQQHENFIQNLRYAKKVSEMEKTGQNLSSLPPPPVTENPDYVQCPNCERTFNPTTAERHIPRCKASKRKR